MKKNSSNQKKFDEGPKRERTYSVVFQEASKGFASMADELAKNKKFNKSRQSIESGDTSVALQVEQSLRKKKFGSENSDFVAPKLKPVDTNSSKTTFQSGEKRKSYVPLPSQISVDKEEKSLEKEEKSLENKEEESKEEGENTSGEEPVSPPKPGAIANLIY